MITTSANTELATSAECSAKRRWRSKQERRQIVEETLQPGASVAVIARRHEVNANQVFHWRKLYQAGLLESESAAVELLPVRVSEVVSPSKRVAREPGSARFTGGSIQIEIGTARVRIEGTPDPACLRTIIESLRQ